MRSRHQARHWQRLCSPPLVALAYFVCVGLPRSLWADVAPDLPPDLETVLPEPAYVVGIGLALSVVIVLFGTRVVASGKLSRRVLNVVLFLIGAATAVTAVYAKKVRVDYANEVQRVRDSYTGPARQYDLDGPNSPTPIDGPPTIVPPGLDPPSVDPPSVDPPVDDTSPEPS